VFGVRWSSSTSTTTSSEGGNPFRSRLAEAAVRGTAAKEFKALDDFNNQLLNERLAINEELGTAAATTSAPIASPSGNSSNRLGAAAFRDSRVRSAETDAAADANVARITRRRQSVTSAIDAASAAADGTSASASSSLDTQQQQQQQRAKTTTQEALMDRMRKRLQYQCTYRGMAELDLVLGAFGRAFLPTATLEELRQFDTVLCQLDTDLYHWLITVPLMLPPGGGHGHKGGSRPRPLPAGTTTGTGDFGAVKPPPGSPAGANAVEEEPMPIVPEGQPLPEWHRTDVAPEALESNPVFQRLRKFVVENAENIVNFH
jgi:succinate dehydrogenase flavin-adding protein (antitoxin of CptAB toxin-antitoxin module)